MRQLKYYLIFSFILLIGCEEFIEPNADQFIVEGFIVAGEPVDNIKIKESLPIDIDTIADLPISNADVVLSGPNGDVTLSYDPTTGKYFDPTFEFSIESGKEYELLINVVGTVATSKTIIPEQPDGISTSKNKLVVPNLVLTFGLGERITKLFDEERITLTWQPETGRSYYVVIESLEDEIDPILPEGIPGDSRRLLSSFRFVSEPSEITTFEIIGVALETYGKHVAKVYSVNQEYSDLFNSAAQDSRDLNEPPSNINNGLGIFSGFAVATIEFEVARF
ncbi:MAG: DUF4249 family protein [Bacteroidota bacterium]